MAEWTKRLESQNIRKQDLNQIVLNYLIFEGYETTAIKFAKEIGIDLTKPNPIEHISYYGINSIQFRKEIKSYLLNGDIQIVIDKLKLEYPDLLEKNLFLHFKLLLLHLIEMIKRHNKDNQDMKDDKDEFILNIIDFAKKKLTGKALKNPKFMEELELTMTLLLYSNNEQTSNEFLPDKLKELLKFKLRVDIADLINKSILLENVPHLLDFNDANEFKENFNENDEKAEDFYYKNQLIDSSLKKMIKVWLWGEKNIGPFKEKEFKKFEL